jgi:hypothetical protein
LINAEANLRIARHRKFFAVAIAAIFAAACDGANAPAAENGKSCRETPPAELSAAGHGCAYAAELQAIAHTLASVTDTTSAMRAANEVRQSAHRLKKLNAERKKLNDDPQAGAKGAMVGLSMPKVSAASRMIVEETIRIMRDKPDLWRTIGPAMDEVELQ